MAKEKSLLEKAKEIKASKAKPTHKNDEMEELALAWVRDEVTLRECALALGMKKENGSIYSKIALALKGYLSKTEAYV